MLKNTINFYNSMVRLESELSHDIIVASLYLHHTNNNSWASDVSEALQTISTPRRPLVNKFMRGDQVNLQDTLTALKSYYSQCVRQLVSNPCREECSHRKLSTYFFWFHAGASRPYRVSGDVDWYKYPPHIKWRASYKQHQALARLMLGCAPLVVNVGRFHGGTFVDRLCPTCSVVDNEAHAVCGRCPHIRFHTDEKYQELFSCPSSIFSNFRRWLLYNSSTKSRRHLLYEYIAAVSISLYIATDSMHAFQPP